MNFLKRLWSWTRTSTSNKLVVYGIGILIVVGGFAMTWQFVDPAPPKVLRIATGSSSGAYFRFAKRYREILKREDITLKIIQTRGSVENIRLLKENKVDIAFVQGGIGDDEDTRNRVSTLGSVYFEPLWVFHRKGMDIKQIRQLQGKRVAVGVEGSGTYALAKTLLDRNNVTGSNATLLKIKGSEAASQLINGKVDAIMLVASANAPLIQKLVTAENVSIMDFERAQAYTRVYSYLTVLSLPKGTLNLAKHSPARDVHLLSTTANLVTQKKLHPAIVNLLMQAAFEVHDSHGLFEKSGQFPTPKYVSFTLHKEAKRFYKHGTPFLQRYLPFWLANIMDRLKIMLLPLLGLMLPLVKILPPFYRWSVRRRIYRWYSELRSVDPEILEVDNRNANKFLEKLERIEEEVTRVAVPLSYADEVYNLRLHIEMVRKELNKYINPESVAPGNG